jgi:hypothetical protein
MAARQFSVRLPNGWSLGDEVTRRDIEVLRRWHVDVAQHGIAPWQVDSQDLVRIDFVLCRAYSEDRMAG